MTAQALDRLLNLLREQAPHQRHQGTYFENLCRAYLCGDKHQSSLYSDVWTYKDWAHKYPDLHEPGQDSGIDLVAKLRDEEGFAAVQCKFYEEGRKIDKKKLNDFLSVSSKVHFKRRIFIDTSGVSWTKTAHDAMRNQNPPVVTVSIYDLRNSSIDWEKFEKQQKPVQRDRKDIQDHQQEALDAVIEGFKKADRGKMIMACGTGKTFTALKIAESEAGAGGRVLFLMPSLALISQAIHEWTLDSEIPLRSFAVCSDSHVGRSRKNPDDEIRVEIHDLAFPATTQSSKVAEKAGSKALDRMTVIFSTYQSLQVLNEAHDKGLPAFDLIICDEAHRTTGVTAEGGKESNFVKVHDNNFVKAKKRLYMTATPRVYGKKAQEKAEEYSAVICSMDDKNLYGEVFYEKTFGSAVEDDLLTDYKVIVLAMEDEVISKALEGKIVGENAIKLGYATQIVGCYTALQKKGRKDEFADDPKPMRRAIAFCERIKESEKVRDQFSNVAKEFNKQVLSEAEVKKALKCEVKHVDGNFNAAERITLLNWLDDKPQENECRILTNARCLSEGVDVPDLDAVLFMHPRKSQIDVVQAVGRVMRKAEGKNLGYVILPVVIPTKVEAEDVLDKKPYKVIWQVLDALRSHDERLEAEINQIDLNQDTGKHIEIIPFGREDYDDGEVETIEELKQARLNIDDFMEAIRAKIVDKCGDREYWKTWAKDIGNIARIHIKRIKNIIKSGEAEQEIFNEYLKEIRANINQSITEEEAIVLLAQHLVTKPVFEAVFNDDNFVKRNAVSEALQKVVDVLEPKNLDKETETLEKFYASVRRRAQGVESDEGRQRIIKDLYNNFFNMAFKDTSKKLGIVYTPIEVVDFIIHSVNDILKQEFSETLGSKGVHILDPFTGAGTFIVRLLQSGLITHEELEYKYEQEIHANEITLLAYYIAAINIELTYHGIIKGNYAPYKRIILTDTFMMGESETLESNLLEKNNTRRNEQMGLKDIRVIISNPPYNVRKKGINYENLNRKIANSYASKENTEATNKNSLYDSYIQAIRWASDRIGDRGVLGFTTNSGWVDGIAMDGMRKCLQEDFTSIYVFELRGNALTRGELRKKEAGNVFGGDTRTPIVIFFLVKNPNAKKHGQIFYHDIGDYLTQKQKLQTIHNFKSTKGIEVASLWNKVQPDQFNDWINHRDPSFYNHLLIGEKDKKLKTGEELFANYTVGLKTQRDAWCYNFNCKKLETNIQKTIDYYNSRVAAFSKAGATAKAKDFHKDNDKEIKWSRALRESLEKGKTILFEQGEFRQAIYRPFTKQWLYYSRQMNEMIYQTHRVFPRVYIPNRTIAITGPGTLGGFDVMMHDTISDLGALSASQNFPLKLFEEIKEPKAGDETSFLDEDEVITGHKETDGITDYGLKHFQEAYNTTEITKEDIFYYVYGLFHSPEYRTRFANNLMKQMPRIPAVKKFDDFKAFSKAGRDLGDLHINYESAERYKTSFTNPTLFTETKDGIPIPLDNTNLKDFYRVEKMKFKGKRDDPDKTVVIYNKNITITEIPEKAYEYMIGGRSALEWVMERQSVKTDTKGKSGIVNDANDYANETMDGPAYPLKLFQRIITVSLETQEIVASLPKLDID